MTDRGTPPSDDPIAEESERARQRPQRSLLPSSDGLGPGAGETPPGDVSAPPSSAQEGAPDVTTTPSLGAPKPSPTPSRLRPGTLDGAPDERGEPA